MRQGKFSRWIGGRRRGAAGIPAQLPPLNRVQKAREPFDDRLPRFRVTASEATARPIGGPIEDQRRARLRRAFTPAIPINDLRMFAGRKDQLLRLIRAVEEQQVHVVIYGDRGMGKTSLLHVFALLARDARYIVRYVSCSETSTFKEVTATLAAEIPLLFHRDLDPTSDRAEGAGTFADILEDRDVTVAHAGDVFEKITGTRALLVLDEFDRVRDPAFGRSIAEFIKALSDRGTPLQLVLAGVASSLTELLQHIPSIRRNVTGLPLGSMTPDEMSDILDRGQTVSGLTFADDAQAAIIELAAGSPYVTNLLGQQAGLATLDRDGESVTMDDVAEAVEHVILDTEQRLTELSRKFLGRLGEGERENWLSFARQALEQFGLIRRDGESSPSEREVIDAGLKAGILTEASILGEEGYRFADDGLALHLWLLGNSEEIAAMGRDVSGQIRDETSLSTE